MACSSGKDPVPLEWTHAKYCVKEEHIFSLATAAPNDFKSHGVNGKHNPTKHTTRLDLF
jgi:hypothetical protein